MRMLFRPFYTRQILISTVGRMPSAVNAPPQEAESWSLSNGLGSQSIPPGMPTRAEKFAGQVRRANELAEEFHRRAMAAEERVGDWRNFEFSANEVGSLHSPQTPSRHSPASSAQSQPYSLKTQTKHSRLAS
jgi:hypothetical protein